MLSASLFPDLTIKVNGVPFDLRTDLQRLIKKAGPFAVSKLVQHLPVTPTSRFNGVSVDTEPFRWAPFYEGPLVDGIRSQCQIDDHAVVIGGGIGVSTVITAQEVGSSGSVTVYEGSHEQTNTVRGTVDINDVEDRCTVIQGIVGEAVELYGRPGNAKQIDPADLPEMEVLIMDCEGAELEILQDLAVRPRVIVVETHGHLDAPTQAVQKTLRSLGYNIQSNATVKSSQGVDVLTAVIDQ